MSTVTKFQDKKTEVVDSNLPVKLSNGKCYVTGKNTAVYSDSELNNKVSDIPVKKIIEIVQDQGEVLKVRYNGMKDWIENKNLSIYNVKLFGKVVNYVPYVSQLYPVYAPNGCEPTSMLMALRGKGYTNIGLRSYLDAIPKTKTNPRYGYVGVPYNVEEHRSQRIDPQALANYGCRYGKVENIQGATIEDIKRELQNGNSVVVWVTLYWNEPYFKTLRVDGKPERRIWNNHAVLLTGYDPDKKMFYVADPYNHEKSGASRTKPFYYWKSEKLIDKYYNYDNRRFAVVVR